MTGKFEIPISDATFGALDAQYLAECLQSGMISSRSPFVEKLAAKFHTLRNREALPCSSGYASLWLALRALDLQPGSQVLVPAITFAATANAVILAGFEPVIVDCHPRTGLIDPEAAARRCTRETSACIPVHLFGLFAPVADLKKALPAGVRIIEDCAQVVDIAGKPNFDTDAECYSLFANKVVTAGEGGILVAHPSVLERARLLRDHGIDDRGYPQLAGANFKLDGLSAAIACAQLETLAQRVFDRQTQEKMYNRHLPGQGTWLYAVHFRDAHGVRRKMADKGVELRPCFPSLAKVEYIRPHHPCLGAEEMEKEVLMLPMGPHMALRQQNMVLKALIECDAYLSDGMPVRPQPLPRWPSVSRPMQNSLSP